MNAFDTARRHFRCQRAISINTHTSIHVARPAKFNNTYCISGDKISCPFTAHRFSECTIASHPNIVSFGYDTWLACFPTEAFNHLGKFGKIAKHL